MSDPKQQLQLVDMESIRQAIRQEIKPLGDRVDRLDRVIFGNKEEEREGLLNTVTTLNRTATALKDKVQGATLAISALIATLGLTQAGPILQFIGQVLGLTP